MIEKRIGIPCLMANNAGLAAMAVLRSGEKENESVNDFVLLVIGDVGVGSGVVIHHNLYSGYDAAYAGEVGHTVIIRRARFAIAASEAACSFISATAQRGSDITRVQSSLRRGLTSFWMR